MSERLMAIVAEGDRGRIYLPPIAEMEAVARKAEPTWFPNTETHGKCRVNIGLYGMTTWDKLFTPRQLVVLTTFSDLVQEARERVKHDALVVNISDDGPGLDAGGTGATAYADAVCVYLAFAVSRLADYGSSLSTWRPKDNAMRSSMPRHALPMSWDFAEGNAFGSSSAGFVECVDVVTKVLTILGSSPVGIAEQQDATTSGFGRELKVTSTDPPYYDNIAYADLSDFYYVWLRRALKPTFPDLFATLAVPKAEELVATPYRHGSKEKAETFFLDGMTRAMHRLAEQTHPTFPVTIYYAFKQSETEDDKGTASTGWETFLDAVLQAGFSVNGTWPMRTEGDNRQVGIGSNALASSIVLVCRPRPQDAPTATRREFLTALKRELPKALTLLQHGNIAPVDLQQSAIGPGMAVFTRYAKVLDSEGKAMRVREALALINQTLDEVLAEQEGDLDADTRWALSWFEQFGFADGEYGVAETLSKAKNTSVGGMVEAGIVASKGGKVRLLKPEELPDGWDPGTDSRLTVWETVHHLVCALEQGETAAAELVAKLGSKVDVARELAYRLYTLCERKKRAAEALAYNGLVQSWPEIMRLAREGGAQQIVQTSLFAEDGE
jgi:putative DNA methylase